MAALLCILEIKWRNKGVLRYVFYAWYCMEMIGGQKVCRYVQVTGRCASIRGPEKS